MYHMGIATVRGLGDVIYVDKATAEELITLLRWPRIQRDVLAAVAADGTEEGWDGIVVRFMSAYYLADALHELALDPRPSSPLVRGPSGKLDTVNPQWIADLYDIDSGLKAVDSFLSEFLSLGGIQKYPTSRMVTTWLPEMEGWLRQIETVAKALADGLRNTDQAMKARALVERNQRISDKIRQGLKDLARDVASGASEGLQNLDKPFENIVDKFTLGTLIPVAAVAFIAWGALKRK